MSQIQGEGLRGGMEGQEHPGNRTSDFNLVRGQRGGVVPIGNLLVLLVA